MPNTVVGLYRNDAEVQHVVNDLVDNDFPRRSIELHDEAGTRLRGWLSDQGVPEREADEYVDGVRKGGKLVTLSSPDERSRDAVRIMRRHEDHAARAADTGAAVGAAATREAETRTRADDETVQVTEEELDVGTREVERGGVRIRSYVTEEPVQEDVTVRDETIHVDRRPVDRTVSEAEADDAFRERSIEMSETDEEVVVGKRARVIEEIGLSKEVDERTETVSDTVRRTDVEVEGADEGRARGGYAFDDDREHFRTHHRDTFANSDYGYDDFEPAYRYGTDLAGHPDYRDREWNDLAPSARDRWERQNTGTWNEFEPAVRYGWERGRTRRTG